MECYKCGFWDSDYEGCTCPSYEMSYACPIESEKEENKKSNEEMAMWYAEREKEV